MKIYNLNDRHGQSLISMPAHSHKDLILRAIKLGVDLTGADLSHLNLSGIDLNGLRFKEYLFHQTNLIGANLTECEFQGCDFEKADLSLASLDYSRFNECSFLKTSFCSGTSIVNAELSSSRFSGDCFFSLNLREAKAPLNVEYLHESNQVLTIKQAPLVLLGQRHPIVILEEHLLYQDKIAFHLSLPAVGRILNLTRSKALNLSTCQRLLLSVFCTLPWVIGSAAKEEV